MEFVPILWWSDGWIMEVRRRSWRVSPLPLIIKPSTTAGQVHHTCHHEQRCFIIPYNRADQLRSNCPWHRPTRICDHCCRRLHQRQNRPPYDECYRQSAKRGSAKKKKGWGGGGRNVLEFGGSDRKEKKKEGKKRKGVRGRRKKGGKRKKRKKYGTCVEEEKKREKKGKKEMLSQYFHNKF